MTIQAGQRTTTADSLHARLLKTAGRQPERPALKARGGRGKVYRFREMASLIERLGGGLRSQRLTDHREIGILSENRPEWGIAYFSILTAGGTVVPIDANLSDHEIEYIIKHAGLKVIFTSGRFESRLRKLGKSLRLISFEEESDDYMGQLLGDPEQIEDVDPGDTAALIYTSGTTGAPKAVQLTHHNIIANLEGIETALEFGPDDTFLSILPLHHTFEATCGLIVPLIAGGTVVYVRSMKSKEILEDIAHNEVTHMCGVPLLYEKMYHSIMRAISSASAAKRASLKVLYFMSKVGWKLGRKWGRTLFRSLRDNAGLGSIRMFVSGGAAIPPKIAEFFNLIGVTFVQGYGMTECSPVIAVNRPDNIQFGSVGPPLGNLSVRIDSPNEEGVGEIIVKGGSITPGYRGNEEKTRELLQDGWLRTGDLGQFKKDHLWITGRAKNVIVSAAGKNIYPEEIEDHFLEYNTVMEAVVIGRPKSGKQGEEVCAVIVPDLDQLVNEYRLDRNNPDHDRIREIIASVVNEVNGKIAAYKRIAHFEIQLKELEKTSTQKVKRHAYR